MEGEERRLDRERDGEAEEDQTLSLVPESTRLNVPCVTPNATTDASISSEPAIV